MTTRVLYHDVLFNVKLHLKVEGEYLLERNGDIYFAKEDEVKHLLQPEDVPTEVFKHIEEYFRENEMGYKLKAVVHASEHPADDYLYEVIAVKPASGYACWTCWNDSTRSLNFGHYNLTLDQAADIVAEYYTKLK